MRDEFDDQNHRWLNFRDAARRVDRDLRTIRRWKRMGMPTVMLDGTNYVELDDLLAWWRQRLLNHPCLQRYRARVQRLEQESREGESLASIRGMTKTNRQYDDRKILHGVTDLGLSLLDATSVDAEVHYSAPAMNSVSYATVRLTLEWQVATEVADKLLDDAKEYPSPQLVRKTSTAGSHQPPHATGRSPEVPGSHHSTPPDDTPCGVRALLRGLIPYLRRPLPSPGGGLRRSRRSTSAGCLPFGRPARCSAACRSGSSLLRC